MNKKLLLLAGILALGATTFTAEEAPKEVKGVSTDKVVEISTITDSSAIEGLLAGRQEGIMGEISGSYLGEVRVRSWQGGGRSDKAANGNYKNSVNKIEWTVAKGKVNMGDFGFAYDVDRDYNFNKKWDKTNEAWDTEFGFDYKAGTFDMMHKEWTFNPSVKFGYDANDTYTSASVDPTKENAVTKRLWKFTPKMSTTYMGYAVDISPIIAYDDVEGTTAFELDITNFRALGTTGRWTTYGDLYFDFAGTKNDKATKGKDVYSNDVFNGNIDKENKFALSIEQYLGYERQIDGNFYFVNEFGLEAYSILQSDNNNVAMYAAPEVQYRANLGSFNVTPYAKYVAYTATGAYETNGSSEVNKDELSVGVRFGTKF